MTSPSEIRISIAGAGNVGNFLALEFFKAGCSIVQILNRTLPKAVELAQKVNAQAIDNLELIDPDVDLIIMSLPDKEIVGFCEKASIFFPEVVLASTAGSIELKDLNEANKLCGVFYPLQSFTLKTHPRSNNIPVCIEGPSDDITGKLKVIASIISNDVREVSSQQRLFLHLAAVFACNFSNHMFTIAHQIIDRSGIDFDILWPLVNETVSRLKQNNPEEMQTGPAIRNDQVTINKHLEMLKSYEDEYISKLYSLISESITHAKS